MTETRGRRLSMSFSPEQVVWLHEVLALARRSNDARVLMTRVEATKVSRTVLTAVQKVAGRPQRKRKFALSHPTMREEARYQSPFCRNDHPFVEENTGHDKRGGITYRVCLECRRLKKERATTKRHQMFEERKREKWARIIESRAEAAE